MHNSNVRTESTPCSFPLLEPGMRHIVLTVDCEIFGNGVGDVRQHIVDPTERIAALGDQHGVPITFFTEVEEYLAFEQYADQLRERLGYDPARLIRGQIISLVCRGHDVQLHLHPQWYNAQYAGGRWLLHEDKQTVDALFQDQEQVTQYIKARKTTLESILQEADPERVVRAYRAGGFCAQPGEKLLAALATQGIIIESSVVKGLYRPNAYACDYRAAPPSRKVWRVASDVCVEEPSGPVFEIPVHSVMGRRLGQASFHRIQAKFSGNVPKEKQKEMVSQLGVRWQPMQLIKFLWQEVPIKLDFHNVSARTIMRWIRSAEPAHNSKDLDVLVLIGHTKEHISDRMLERLLESLSREPNIKVTTFDQLAKAILSSTENNPSKHSQHITQQTSI